MPFSSLGLRPELTAALQRHFSAPTEIQTLSVPAALGNQDIFALAQTGSGKTLAFGLPLIEKSLNQPKLTSSIVLTPTRELAGQITHSINAIASDAAIENEAGITCLTLTGGCDIDEQLEQLRSKPNIVVATPGRLLELMTAHDIAFETLQSVVLDEADRMLDMGFWPDVSKLLTLLPSKRQVMMFSATFPQELEQKAQHFLFEPQRIQAQAIEDDVSERINESLYLVNKGSKANVLIAQLQLHKSKQTLVFVGAKDNADAICKKLSKAGIPSAALHGNKEQSEREDTLSKFKSGEIQALVSTDLLARGIHIESLPLVINFDLPSDPKTYTHRVGRTARAGQNGTAISLVCHGETAYLEAIRTHTERELPLTELEGFPVTDKPSSGNSKRAPRDKQANRRTNKKTSIKQFRGKPRGKKPQ
ncbi:DEAD/DEAH box helicase [Vibrio agarivorans]|uniref:DEAD/DEAH box helicase n=1 Tax=Vibrio agarivorans TaxID=153622 RepID=UPI00222FFE59|nr:DEAD/DEAH box helicase [Vibrio agarivorans]